MKFICGVSVVQLWDIYHSEIPAFLAEAANTAALQRLNDVGMNCGCEYTKFPLFANIGPYSRYDHSMGVALIVWHFTEDKAQAMAGLLHDISTPAFAHVIDFLHGDHMTQESTEQETEKIIRGSAELCEVLHRCGLVVENVADYHIYPIADNDSPKLSADRLEYTLGNGVNYGIINREEAASLYGELTDGENEYGETELIFKHAEIARAFADVALECSKIYVADSDRYAMQSLAEILKCAIESNVILETDLYRQERDIITKLKQSPLSDRWEQFCNYSEIIRSETPEEDSSWLCVPAKKRSIDPYIMGVGRVSDVFPDFRERLCKFRESRQDYWLSAR